MYFFDWLEEVSFNLAYKNNFLFVFNQENDYSVPFPVKRKYSMFKHK